MSDTFDPNKVRLLNNEGEPFAFLKVKAIVGQGGPGKTMDCNIDPVTGALDIPKHNLFGKINSHKEAGEHAGSLVTSFHMTVGCHADARLVVAQRQGGALKYRKARESVLPGAEGAELVEFNLPRTVVAYWDRKPHELRDGLRSLGVRTNPMNRNNSNRLDMWLVGPKGELTLYCVYLITLDDGLSFRAVMQQRWLGRVYRRKPGTQHTMRNPDERAVRALENSEVRRMFEEFVFVPGDDTEDFSARAGALEDQKLREFIRSSNLSTWNGAEDFWIKRRPATNLKPGQGSVEFMTYAAGNGSFGIIDVPVPAMVNEYSFNKLQFDHHSVVNPDEFTDEQGILQIPPGSTIEYDEVFWMGVDSRSGQPYPAYATKVTILEVPVAIAPKSRTAA